MGQHVTLRGGHNDDEGPGSPVHDSWYDDEEDGETAESYEAWYEGRYAEWDESEA